MLARARVDSAPATVASNAAAIAPNHPVRFIAHHIRRHLLAHIGVVTSVIAAVACAVGSQYAVKHLVDLLTAGQRAGIWVGFALLAGLIAGDNMLWRVAGWLAAHSFVAVTGDLRRELFEHLLGHGPAYFAERRPGALAGRVSATGQAVYRIESLIAWNVLPPCLAVLGAILVLASVNGVMAAVLIVISVALGAALAYLAASGRPLHKAYAHEAASVDGELVDVINNALLVRAFGAHGREVERFNRGVGNEMSARTRSLRFLEKLRIFHAVICAALTACLLAWALLLWERGQASAGDVVLVSTLGFTILHGTRDLAVALVDMIQDFARLEDAIGALLVPHDLADDEDAQAVPVARGRVVFDRVDFSYPDGAPVLRRFTLRIEPGTRLGLVGRSGAGKSTLLGLLQRLYDVSGGRLLVDDYDIRRMTQASLASAIAVVSQDVMLFHRSVLENVRYGKPDASDAEVMRAIDAAGCATFIDALPDGAETIVGDRGVKLSGGQRQRLAIARAFLCDAPILLLDEATSALDSESEAAVQAALARLMYGRTVIAAAHRLSTLRGFDRVIVLDHGRIVQDGRPDVLARKPGLFRDLLRRQAPSVLEAAA